MGNVDVGSKETDWDPVYHSMLRTKNHCVFPSVTGVIEERKLAPVHWTREAKIQMQGYPVSDSMPVSLH